MSVSKVSSTQVALLRELERHGGVIVVGSGLHPRAYDSLLQRSLVFAEPAAVGQVRYELTKLGRQALNIIRIHHTTRKRA